MQNHADLLEGLNSQQFKAVTHADGSLLVLAGAGSGKTKVLTTRLAWLIRTRHLGISEVLAVTFTNKAAREMLNRVGRLLHTDTKYMWVGTFHSIALRLLRAHYQEAGLPASFQIIDAGEQQSLIKRLIKQKGLDEDRYPAKEIQSYINYQKEQGLRAAQLTPDGLRTQQWLEIYNLYEETCNRDGLVDFTELLLRSYELLAMHDGLLRRYQQQFKHILVDEFQDTNQLQYLWLKILVGAESEIFAVGDDDQSIYSFRGAKVSNMRAFLRDFNAPEPLRLEQNYRSTTTILDAANALINNNSERIGKNLWTDNAQIDKIRLYEGYTEEDEAYFVIDEIKSLHNNGIDLADMAILYRSNAQSRVFEQHLYNRGLAYKVYGGLRFFDRLEIKRVLAYLRVIVNPYDNEAFLRIVNFPARGIGARTIENLQELALQRQISLFDAVEFLPGKSKLTVGKFIDLIRMMQSDIKVLNLTEVISYIIETSGIRAHFEADPKEGEERLDNLNELVTAVSGFTAEDADNPLVEFLAHAVLESVDNQAQNLESAVQLMTVHAAKGLEFKVVFVVGLEEGLFPHDNALKNLKDVEEERRLMYVAITRARDKLYLLRACSRLLWGKRISAPISRFVDEIPEELILNISGVSSIGYSQLNEYDTPKRNNFKLPNNPAQVANPESKTSRVVLVEKDLTIKIGDMVRHAKFGQGKVLRLNSDGKKMTAEIFFIGMGKKNLDLNIANIEKVN
ncbi:MAG TPA: DNA helicase II [Neisseriales bacterium]|nr:DNA helicase II [Neisseriales bacterium]